MRAIIYLAALIASMPAGAQNASRDEDIRALLGPGTHIPSYYRKQSSHLTFVPDIKLDNYYSNPPILILHTNLPDTERAVIHVTGVPPYCAPNCWIGSGFAEIKNGTIAISDKATGPKPWKNGQGYLVRILIFPDNNVPKHISLLGKNGANMKGALVREMPRSDPKGLYIYYEAAFSVTNGNVVMQKRD